MCMCMYVGPGVCVQVHGCMCVCVLAFVFMCLCVCSVLLEKRLVGLFCSHGYPHCCHGDHVFQIFGPILPIVTVKDVDEAIAFVNSKYVECVELSTGVIQTYNATYYTGPRE